MEDVEEYLSSRRKFIKTGTTATLTGLTAGCSGGNDGNSGGSSPDTGTSTDETGAEAESDQSATEEDDAGNGTESTETPSSEQSSGSSSLLEEDEPQVESEYEKRIDKAIPNEGWIEIENPEEQIPRENYDLENYPNLQLLKDEDHGFNAYDPENEAVYLIWLEYENGIGLTAFQITDYGSEDGFTQSLGSDQYTDQSADIEGILSEVVESVDDVPKNLDEEYAQLLT